MVVLFYSAIGVLALLLISAVKTEINAAVYFNLERGTVMFTLGLKKFTVVKLRLFMREKGPEYSLNGRPAKKLVLSGKKNKKSKKMKITSLLAAYNDIIGFSKISADIVFCDEAATAALTGRFIYDMLEGALVTLNVRRPKVNVKILYGAERAVSDIRISTRPSVKLLAEVLIRSIRRTRHAI